MTSLTDTLAHAELLEVLAPAMREAGALIEDIKARGIVHHDKADSSPVTEADEAAEALLEAAIRRIEPGAVIVGEEAVAAGTIPDVADRFWLIDPLDGTRGFVKGGEAFTVNIALVHQGAVVAGVVSAPATGLTWRSDAGPCREGKGASRRRFGEAWQDRVRRMLLEHADDPAMVRVSRIG